MTKIKEVDLYGNEIIPGPSKLNRPCSEHPYGRFFDTKLWRVIDKAIDDLVKNQDFEELTHRSYIVGYLCKKLSAQKSIEVIVKTRGKDEWKDADGSVWIKA